MTRPRVVMALMFFPRGGSSHVVRNLARFLPDSGWDVTLLTGSLGPPGKESNAETFFEGFDVHSVDYTAALEAPDPLRADPPFHPSFEDRPAAPDRVFAKVDDETYEHLVTTWQQALAEAGAADADLLHLNHLTPMHEAAIRSFPDVPRIGHLHGTEMLMLRDITEGAPAGWQYAETWAERLRRWAQASAKLFVLSTDAAKRVPPLLGVGPERVVAAPNGFDPELFDRRPLTGEDRVALWREWLVDDPRGWQPGDEPGSIAYNETDLGAFRDGPVLVYVGRYTEVKRIPLLIRAYARARERFDRRVPLVLLGGYPGEFEGEHPQTVIEEIGVEDVFITGWRSHNDLAIGLNAADVVVLPSVHEQFGQVLTEGMACGLPVIAVNNHGPATIVDDGETGLLVPSDDEDAMVEALVRIVTDDEERRRMGETAYRRSRERYSWPALAERVAEVYDDVVRSADAPPTLT
ncbi:MAG TPA: glycosyltransferase family 4 protein [Thermoleophilaceae bacterium]|nr:glycosyltransferase family 4 protein [Thermoleophilaceae bacterium]